MTVSTARLHEVLSAAANGRGVASVSVIDWPGAEPRGVWLPQSADEPSFLVYSVTKTVTASVILRLCAEGRLSLDDPLSNWFPHIERATQISVRRLLNHTGGIPDYGGNAAYHRDLRSSPTTPWTYERFAAETCAKGLLFAPGQGWEYSNPGYMLLKRIAEIVTAEPYEGLVAEYITKPLRLRRTFVPRSVHDLAPLAPGTSTQLSADRSPRDVRFHYHPGWVSHGVVASTSSEIARFLDGLFSGVLLSRASLDEMLELVAVPDAEDSNEEDHTHESPLRFGKPSYGLGVMADPASPWGLLVGHNGGGPCYSASAFHAPELGGITVCAMGAIEEGFSAEQVVADVLDLLLEHSSSKPRPVGRL